MARWTLASNNSALAVVALRQRKILAARKVECKQHRQQCPPKNARHRMQHQTQLTALQTRLGYTFADVGLLKRAMTHRSFSVHNNERLEYLGDAVLGLATAALLYERFARAREDEMSRMRAVIVCNANLAECARGLGIGDCLLLGDAVLRGGVGANESMLADALEATLGALYLDGGWAAVQAAVARWFAPQLETLSPQGLQKDDKTQLQERLQKIAEPPPQYEVISQTGKSHQPVFTVACHVSKLSAPAIASGASRRNAEQCAARIAIAQLDAAQ